MSLEKLVLELFGRVATLEEKNKEITERIDALEKANGVNFPKEDDEIKITRSKARDYLIENLKKHNPAFDIKKGNREMGADLVVTKGQLTYPLMANFYFSKSHEESFVRGWHTVKEEDLRNENIHFFVFLVEQNGKFYNWLFDRVSLLVFCKQSKKLLDSKNTYHFYFTVKDGKNYEDRDSEIDALPFYDKWDVPTDHEYSGSK